MSVTYKKAWWQHVYNLQEIPSRIPPRLCLFLKALYDPQIWSSASPLRCLEYWGRIVWTDGTLVLWRIPFATIAPLSLPVDRKRKGRLIAEDPTSKSYFARHEAVSDVALTWLVEGTCIGMWGGRAIRSERHQLLSQGLYTKSESMQWVHVGSILMHTETVPITNWPMNDYHTYQHRNGPTFHRFVVSGRQRNAFTEKIKIKMRFDILRHSLCTVYVYLRTVGMSKESIYIVVKYHGVLGTIWSRRIKIDTLGALQPLHAKLRYMNMGPNLPHQILHRNYTSA